MTSLADQLRARLATARVTDPLDHPCKGVGSGWGQGYNAGVINESARLAPLHARLIECVEALEEIRAKLTPAIPRMDGKDSWTIQQKFVDATASPALTALREVCGTE